MKQLILIFLFAAGPLLASNAVKPSDLGSITGTVMDKEFQEPIPYATISIKTPEGDLVSGTVSTIDGTFTLDKLRDGTYLFEVQFMGYKRFSKEVEISNSNNKINIGTVFLEAEVAQLDSVEVVAERSTIEQRIDRKVINVGKDLTTMGATASDIMNNVPSVSVDQDGNIALRGNSNVRVLLDGQPTNMDAATLLKQIPSTSIKQIELITNPSAKYNPEGMSGIINIILHKNTNLGFNGDFSGGLTFGRELSGNSNLNLNYREGKMNLYASLGANRRRNVFKGEIFNHELNSGEYIDMLGGNESYLAKIGLDYYINDRNTLSFFTRQNLFYEHADGSLSIRYPKQESLDFTQFADTEEENLSSTYNVVYRHSFSEEDDHTLELEVDHNRYSNDEITNFTYTGATNAQPYADDVDKTRSQTIANLDYVLPLSKGSKLELGAESRILRSENSYLSTNAALEDVLYDYDRDIHSFYTTFGQNFDKWAYQLGARLEKFNVEALQEGSENYEDDYLTLYPSAFLSYTPGENNSFQLSYSRRVDRPSFNQVNPVRQISTPRLSVIGNPELEPQFTNSVELNYTRKLGKNSITAGIFHRMINDNITQVMEQDPLNSERIILSFDNAGTSTSSGVEISANVKPASFWDFNANFNLYSQVLEGYIGTTYVEEDNETYRIQTNHTFKLTKNLRFQLFGMYVSPQKTLQFDIEEFYFMNTGVRYSFLKDKASLSLNFNDVFNTNEQHITTDRPVRQTAYFNPDSQQVNIAFTYRFGGGKNKALQRKQRDDNTAGGGGMF
ncbi:TonB-dependent receptor domain-containing protein [Salinimicrobium sp. GXAS 041]|uniref:TonB-dependent receptor domain-containing protein n=1 Tax=Salinimicrobium sp. GXAS 041 TaxID=3400806 RepID=UPI003C724CCD